MSPRQAAKWAGVGVGSIALHIGAIIGLGWMTAPEPVENQQLPKSQINIQAQDVAHVEAREQTAPAEQLNEAAADALRASQGVVPQSRATTVAANSTAVTNTELPSDLVQALLPAPEAAPASTMSSEGVAAAPLSAENVGAVAAPSQTLFSQNAPAEGIAASIPAQVATAAIALPADTQTVATRLPVTVKLALSALPASAPLSGTPPVQTSTTALPPPTLSAKADVAAALTATTMPLPTTPTLEVTALAPNAAQLPAPAVPLAAVANSSAQAASLPLPAVAGKAALAWSGSDTDQVAANSLAAIQAFMSPGDLDTSNSAIGDVRDGITTILASVPCSRLQTTFIPETGQLELRGHLPEDVLRGPVLAALKAQVGDVIPVSDQLLILPRPQCGALAGIADVGLPQSTEQLTNPRVIGKDGFAQNYTYFNGQRLELELVAPDYDGYVYVDFFTADGMVIHLQPNTIVPLEFAPAKSPLTIGKDRGDEPALDITITPPFGQEIAAAFASSVSLYEGLRPLREPAEPYLVFLKEQVAAARARDPGFKGEWVYFFISTKEN